MGLSVFYPKQDSWPGNSGSIGIFGMSLGAFLDIFPLILANTLLKNPKHKLSLEDGGSIRPMMGDILGEREKGEGEGRKGGQKGRGAFLRYIVEDEVELAILVCVWYRFICTNS